MRVVIDARILPGVTGGVAVAVQSLVEGLGRLTDSPDEYTIVIDGEHQLGWIRSFLGPNQKVVLWPHPRQSRMQRLKIRLFRPAARYLRATLDRRVWPEVPVSQGFFEGLGGDVLHIPTQGFTLCAIPTVYNPHDLQHLAFPQFFTPWMLSWRETVYPAGCHLAQVVVVGSQWVKDDVVSRYRVDPVKVQVIPEAAPGQLAAPPSSGELEDVRRRYDLAEPFLLFPGVTWPHKNHLRLFEALARLRDRQGVRVRLVCPGARFEAHWPRLEAALRELRLTDQVLLPGFIPDADLRTIFHLATALVLPSLYEASSLPIYEAWRCELPVGCSNATALPEQVGDAALLFNPEDVDAIAGAVLALVGKPELREELRQRGRTRLSRFDQLQTARAYRATYRRAARLPLTEEDRWLLGWKSLGEKPAR